MDPVTLQRVHPKVTVIEKGDCSEKPSFASLCKIVLLDASSSSLDVSWLQSSNEASEYLHSSFSGELTIGNGDTPIDRRIEDAMCQMWIGEMAKIDMELHPCEFKYVVRHVCSDSNQADPESANVLNLSVTLKLISINPTEELWYWNKDRLLGEAAISKLRGNELFSGGRFVDAFFRYSLASKYLVLIDKSQLKDGDESGLSFQLAAIRNNIACIQQMFENHLEVIHLTSVILYDFPKNVKALLRRAAANLKLQEFDSAKYDLMFVLKLEPQNKDALNLLKDLTKGQKECDSKLALGMKKMFA